MLGRCEDGTAAIWPRPVVERAGHVAVLAAAGAGKTVLVAAAVLEQFLEAFERGAPQSLVAVDPKGDLVAALLAGLAAQAPAALARTNYLNPFSPGAFPFNLNQLALASTPLDIRAAQLANLCGIASTATGAQRHLGVGARQVDALHHVILGALSAAHPAANITWALEALSTRSGMRDLAALAQSRRAKAFLEQTELGPELKTSCAARLRAAFASCEQLERVVAAPSCVNLEDLTAPGTLTLIDLGAPPAGVEALTAVWANLLLRLLVERLMARPSPYNGHAVQLVLDEAQVLAPVLSDVAERTLTLGRSRALSLVTLSQGTTLLQEASPTLLRVLLTNTPTKLAGRLAVADAELLAREQAPRPGVEESPATLRARLTVMLTNLEDRQFVLLRPGGRVRFTSRQVDLHAWDEARHVHAAEIAACMDRLSLPSNLPPPITLSQAAAEVARVRARSRPAPANRPCSPWG